MITHVVVVVCGVQLVGMITRVVVVVVVCGVQLVGMITRVVVSADRYIATTTLAIIAVFLDYLRQFLIDLHQT